MWITANPRLRVLYTIWAFFECTGFAGLIIGWSSLVYVLKEEGIYEDLCHHDTGNASVTDTFWNFSSVTLPPELVSCSAQDSRLALVFTIAAAVTGLGSFVIGQIDFRYGTRISRTVATFIFMAGAFMVAFTSKETPWLIFPGYSLLGFGGISFLMTNTQISNMYPSGAAAVVGFLCGGYDSSAGIQLMVKLGFEAGISRKTSYIIIGATSALTFISTFLFLPRGFIHKELPSEATDRNVPEIYERSVGLDDERNSNMQPYKQIINAISHEDANEMPKLDRSNPQINHCEAKQEETCGGDNRTIETGNVTNLKGYIISPTYILHVLWLAVLQLRFLVFIGTINSRMEKMMDTKSEVSQFTNVLLYVQMGGVITSPLAGFFYGGQYRFYKDRPVEHQRQVMPAILPLAVTTTLAVLISGLMIIDQPNVLYAVFVLVLLFRSFMYTLAAGYISAIFPSAYFGSLYGLMIVVCAVIGLSQNALFSWAEGGGYQQANIFMLGLSSLTFIHPIYQWWTCGRRSSS